MSEPSNQLKRLFTLKEISKLTGFSLSALRGFMYAGEIGIVRTSARGKVRIAGAELDRFIQAHSLRYGQRPASYPVKR